MVAAVDAAELAKLVEARDRIPRKAFDDAIARIAEPGFSADPYLAQEAVSDTASLEPIVDAILAANPAQVEQYRGGKDGLLGFFVGQVMKETKGPGRCPRRQRARPRQAVGLRQTRRAGALRSAAWPSPPNPGISLDELRLAARNHAMPLEALRWPITPVGLHYLLIHYDVPLVDPASWRLELGGAVERPLALTLEELRARPPVELAVTMECAGNGRALLEPRPISQPWLTEAIGTGLWRGVELAPLLEEAAPGAGAVDVVFSASTAVSRATSSSATSAACRSGRRWTPDACSRTS